MVFAAPPLFTCKPIVIRGHMFTLFEWEQNQNLEILEKNNYTKHGFLFIKHILFKNTLIISAFSASTNFSPFTHINAYSFLFTLHYTLTLKKCLLKIPWFNFHFIFWSLVIACLFVSLFVSCHIGNWKGRLMSSLE